MLEASWLRTRQEIDPVSRIEGDLSATNGFFSTTAAYAAESVARKPASTRVSPEDESLMLRIQSGDEQALGLLFERYATTVLSIGLKVLRDREEAEELVQDVFFQVYRKSQLYDPAKGTARTWLLRTTYHRAFDRREYLQLRRFYDTRSVDDIADQMCAASDVEYEVQINQREAIVRKAFEELSEKQRETLTLFFFEGYTLREISEHLKESLANIRHYYYRGIKHLKSHLDRPANGRGKQALHEL
jgi:RNA polymerase sigma-70 factor, ECF subfamily